MRNCNQQLKEAVKCEIEELVKRIEREYELGRSGIPWLPYCVKTTTKPNVRFTFVARAGVPGV
jgi:hypothetical protein